MRDAAGKAQSALPDYRIDLQTAGVSLAAGATYRLRIVMPSGDSVTGETKVPSATPGPMPPATDFARLRDTLRLSWNRVGGARAYEVQVWAIQSFSYNGMTYNSTNLEYTAFVDTALTLAGTAKTWDDNDIFPTGNGSNSVAARVRVYAVDDNYYEYYRLLGDPFIGAAPGHLKGGLGVFGAIVPVVQRQLTIR